MSSFKVTVKYTHCPQNQREVYISLSLDDILSLNNDTQDNVFLKLKSMDKEGVILKEF